MSTGVTAHHKLDALGTVLKTYVRGEEQFGGSKQVSPVAERPASAWAD